MAVSETMSRILSGCLLFAVYVLVAAASFSGYFAKYAFWDDEGRNSFVRILTLQATRPFVYRQLIPEIAKAIGGRIPQAQREVMLERWKDHPSLPLIYTRATGADSGPYAVEYHIAYLVCFMFWLGALMLLAQIAKEATHDPVAALAAPLIFALIFPLLLTRGGYFYDPVEMFFFAASLLFASRGMFLALWLITPVGSYNKESFLFWLPCLWYLFPASVGKLKRTVVLGAAVAISGATYLINKSRFVTNPGGAVEFHLWENIRFYLTPDAYFRREYTYGLALPVGVSWIDLALLAALLYLGWRELPDVWKKHGLVALIINMPLFLMFCWLDELRNLSLLFIVFTVLIAVVLRRGIRGSAVTA